MKTSGAWPYSTTLADFQPFMDVYILVVIHMGCSLLQSFRDPRKPHNNDPPGLDAGVHLCIQLTCEIRVGPGQSKC